MADYQLRARIPQETADKLFTVMKDIQEVTMVADITTSSITRAALEKFIKDHEDEKSNKYINMQIPIEKLTEKELEKMSEKFQEIQNEFKGNKEVALAFARLSLQFLIIDRGGK
ncbi:hypothetical protein [Clostridium sp.]|uniref:hypothetical protein n=1 Tax=Clostridium sp. TaxID=1506 RepID=UPI003FD89376